MGFFDVGNPYTCPCWNFPRSLSHRRGAAATRLPAVGAGAPNAPWRGLPRPAPAMLCIAGSTPSPPRQTCGRNAAPGPRRDLGLKPRERRAAALDARGTGVAGSGRFARVGGSNAMDSGLGWSPLGADERVQPVQEYVHRKRFADVRRVARAGGRRRVVVHTDDHNRHGGPDQVAQCGRSRPSPLGKRRSRTTPSIGTVLSWVRAAWPLVAASTRYPVVSSSRVERQCVRVIVNHQERHGRGRHWPRRSISRRADQAGP